MIYFVSIKKIREQNEKDFLESLKIIDLYVAWIKKTPNKVWSGQQAKLYKDFYDNVNREWRKENKLSLQQ